MILFKRLTAGLRRQALVPVMFITVAIVVVAGIWLFLPKAERKTRPPAKKPVPVRVRVVQHSNVRDMLYLPAVVIPERVVQVAAEVSGRVESYAKLSDRIGNNGKIIPGPETDEKIDEGISVNASCPLLYLNQDILLPEFQRTDAAYRLALREYWRVKSVAETGAATKTELDRSQTSMQTAKAEMELAVQRLRRSVIKSPIAGVVDRIYVEEGDYVSPGKPVADIVDMSTAKIVFNIPEKDFNFFRDRKSEEIDVYIRDSGEKISGIITYISARADEGSLTTPIHVSVDNSSRKLHSGQILKADILCREVDDAIMVPLKSVIAFDEKGKLSHAVYVVKDGISVRKYIEIDLGILRGEDVFVSAGLEVGDVLIVEGQRQVGPDQEVSIIGRTEPAQPARE